MPLDTLAREAVWNVTGKRSVWGVDPVAMALGWALEPQAWVIQPIVPVKDARLAAEIGLPPGTRWSSFQALARNERLNQLMDAARTAEQQERPLAPLEKSAQKLEGRLLWMQTLLNRDALRSCPRRRPATRGRPPSTCTPPPTSARCSTPVSPPGASRPSGSRPSSSTTGPAPPASRGGC